MIGRMRHHAGRLFSHALLSGLLAAAGCAWIPLGDPPAEFMEAPEMKETLAELTSRLQQWPDERWWEQFGNPELNRLIETALKDNPGLKVASARLREAQGLVRVEGARLLPFFGSQCLAHVRAHFTARRLRRIEP